MSVLLPLVLFFVWWGGQQSQPVSDTQVTVSIQPGAQNTQSLLCCVAGEHPSFTLLYADCPAEELTVVNIPAQTVVRTPEGNSTLAECYTAAGPARVADLLSETLGCTVPVYLAADPDGWENFLPGGTARVDLSRILTTEQRRSLGLNTVVEWLPSQAENALMQVEDISLQNTMRLAFWEAFVRQNMENLPAVPQAVRDSSTSILTDLTAQDLLKWEDTLNYLSTHQTEVVYTPLPGTYNRAGTRFDLNQDSVTAMAGWLGKTVTE